jgi:tetratricopeptide (TPR) repeat protein
VKTAAFISLLVLAWASISNQSLAESPFSLTARHSYDAAKSNYLHTASAENGWKFARSCFDWAEFAKEDDDREKIGLEGVRVCEKILKNDPKSVQAHYYLGMNLGQIARTKTVGALKIVRDMEKEFQAVLALDAAFDYHGADRNLGLLYLEAPGWPTSIGNKKKARTHLEAAVVGSPQFPENHLNLLDAYLRWEEGDQAARAWTAAKKVFSNPAENFKTDFWVASWEDWNRRWKKLSAQAKP